MKKIFYLGASLAVALGLSGCDGSDNTLITPDAAFYERGRELEENGTPPLLVGPQAGKIKAMGPTIEKSF